MSIVVRDTDPKLCMVYKRSSRHRVNNLEDYLLSLYKNNDNETVITYQQYESKEHKTLTTHAITVDDFVEKVANAIDALRTHSFIAKCENQFLKDSKPDLVESHLKITNLQFKMKSRATVGTVVSAPCIQLLFTNNESYPKNLCVSFQMTFNMIQDFFTNSKRTYKLLSWKAIMELENWNTVLIAALANTKTSKIFRICAIITMQTGHSLQHHMTNHYVMELKAVKRLLTRTSLQLKPGEQPIDSAKLDYHYCKGNINGITFQFIDQ